MTQHPSFHDVMARLRIGDDDAAAQVFHRFAHRLIALAQSRLDQRVRRKTDPEDVVQSAFRSFFAGYADRPLDVQSWDSLWSLLVVITLRKCGGKLDYFHAECRDVDREEAPPEGPDRSDLAWDVAAPEPTPAEAAMLTELVERMLDQFTGRQRDIVELRLQGMTPAEISNALGCTERTVFRILERVRDWLGHPEEQSRGAG